MTKLRPDFNGALFVVAIYKFYIDEHTSFAITKKR